MKVAICLYGQPRDYNTGYTNIQAFLKQQQNIDFDFFFHAWTIQKDESYLHSPWRDIHEDKLKYNESMKEDLLKFYNPILYEYENQITNFNTDQYINTLAYKNMNEIKRVNLPNFLSNMYSKNKVRNLLYKHCVEKNVVYDFIVMVRFDYGGIVELDLNTLDKNKTYVTAYHAPRKLFTDAFIICPQYLFLEWFNIFNYLPHLVNNEVLHSFIQGIGEVFELNPEVFLYGLYVYVYYSKHNTFDFDSIIYTPSIKVL